jgi:hypothetical protein
LTVIFSEALLDVAEYPLRELRALRTVAQVQRGARVPSRLDGVAVAYVTAPIIIIISASP